MRTVLLACAFAVVATPALAQDQIDLRAARIVSSSPQDIGDWTPTVRITGLEIRPEQHDQGGGLGFTADRSRWLDHTPPGWEGPIQYTVWACAPLVGRWACGGFIQMWRSRASTGAPLLQIAPGELTRTNWSANWAYALDRHAPLSGYIPTPGSPMAFFLSAGNARDVTTVTSVRERSNVVLVNLPDGDRGHFEFGTDVPVPTPSPTPVPPTGNLGGTVSSEEFRTWALSHAAWAASIQQALEGIRAAQERIYADDLARHKELLATVPKRDPQSDWVDVGKFTAKYGPLIALAEELLRRYVVH